MFNTHNEGEKESKETVVEIINQVESETYGEYLSDKELKYLPIIEEQLLNMNYSEDRVSIGHYNIFNPLSSCRKVNRFKTNLKNFLEIKRKSHQGAVSEDIENFKIGGQMVMLDFSEDEIIGFPKEYLKECLFKYYNHSVTYENGRGTNHWKVYEHEGKYYQKSPSYRSNVLNIRPSDSAIIRWMDMGNFKQFRDNYRSDSPDLTDEEFRQSYVSELNMRIKNCVPDAGGYIPIRDDNWKLIKVVENEGDTLYS